MPLIQKALCLLFLFTASQAVSNQFYHISDWHVDPYYLPTKSPGSDCHNITEFLEVPELYQQYRDENYETFLKGTITPNYNFGQYGCDPPFPLVNAALQAMVSILPDPDFIIYSGDMSAHHLRTANTRSTAIRDTVIALRSAFPNTLIFPTIGNNDCYPDYHLAYHKDRPNKWLENLYSIWSQYVNIPADQENQFINGGYYSATVNDTLVVVVLNTIYLCTGHTPGWSDTHEPDPANQFAWLNATLQSAKQNSQVVYINGHVPPGTGWQTGYLNQYFDIVKQYSSIIVGQFYGHTHKDEIHLVDHSSGGPYAYYLQTPSLTPKSDSNPAFRIVQYDSDSYALVNFQQYYTDLLTIQRTSKAVWRQEYDFVKEYQLSNPGIDLTAIVTVLQSMQSDPRLFNYYLNNYDVQYVNPSVQATTLCGLYYIDGTEESSCANAGPFQTTDIL